MTMFMSKKNWVLACLFLFVAGGIFFFSSQPYAKQSLIPLFDQALPHDWITAQFSGVSYTYAGSVISIDSCGVSGFVEFHVRKAAHMFVFACFASVVFFIAKRFTKKTFMSTIIALSSASTYAALDEFHQSFTPGRTPSILDVCVDITGATLGLLFLFVLTFLIRIKKNKKLQFIEKNA